MQSSKGKWSLFIIVIVIIIVIAVVANKSFSSSTIKIGAMYPLTGGLATYGEPSQKTAQLAVDDINAAGGINGKKLEVVFQDHKCDPKAAVSALQQLTGSGIRVFTSGACTGTVLAMEPILQSTDSVLVGSTLSGSKISSSSPNVFRNWGQDINEAKLFADTIKQAGYKKVAVIYEETDYAKGLEVALENYLKGTSVKVSSESFTTGATDIRTQLTKLKGGNPDLLFVSPQTVTSGEVVLSQMEELKFSPARIFVNDNVIKSADLVSKHAKILQGALGGDYVIAQNDKLAAVLQKYKTNYGEDCPQTNICAAVYDTIYLLAGAIKSQDYNAAAIQSYLKTVNYDGVSGSISFDASNDRSNTAYSLFQVKDGKAVIYQQ